MKTAVVIVGGGPVGLTAALFLEHYAVPFILVEKTEHDSILPRGRGWDVRTLEIFRQVGVEDAAQQAAKAAWKQGTFGGARRGRTMINSEALNVSMAERAGEGDPSPSTFCACPQTLLEAVLRRTLEERGADLQFGSELTALSQGEDGITAFVRDKLGKERTISAAYCIGADGGRSLVRSTIGIETTRMPAETHYLNLFFGADLTEAMRDRTFSQCEIVNGRMRGLFLSNNNTTEWSFHLEYDPETSNPTELSDAALTEILRSAIGIPNLPIEILAKTKWSDGIRIADVYQRDRVFLVGDAAHLMPPWGGFNGNTGVADAHNLAWKLAAVISGNAEPKLLASYGEERRPVAVRNGRQALLRMDFDARFEIETETNREVFEHLQNRGALLMRYGYAGRDDGRDPRKGLAERLCGQPGTRFPHAWIKREGNRISTLDLFGESYVLLQGPDSRESIEHLAMSGTALRQRAYRVGTDFSFCDGDVTWCTLTSRTDHECVLVRPDGFVAYGPGDM